MEEGKTGKKKNRKREKSVEKWKGKWGNKELWELGIEKSKG